MTTGRGRAFAPADDDDPPLHPPVTDASPPFSRPICIPRGPGQPQQSETRGRQSSSGEEDGDAAAEDGLHSPLHDDEDDLDHAPSTYSVSLPHQSSPSLFLPLSTVPVIQLQHEGGDESPESPDAAAAADAVSAVDSSSHVEHVGETVASFRLLSVLGRGGYGVVYLVLHQSSQRVYAMKVMRKSLVLSKKVGESARHEREVLSLIHHPFLVTLRYAFQSASKLYLVMDFVQGGELWRRLDSLPGRSMSERDCRFYAAEVVLALEYLHARDIIYRDLKPENVLLDRRGHVVLSDFGFAKSCVTGERSSNSFLGTAHAMSPEMVDGSGHGKGTDWWALGVLICELLTGRPPFSANNRQQLQQQILSAQLHLPQHLSLHAKHLISQLLKRQLDRRLGCGEGGVQAVKAHPFFAGINWQKLGERKVAPPWVPPLRGERDVSMFDPDFTNETVCDSPSSLRGREGSLGGREGGGGRGRGAGKGAGADSEDEEKVEKERVRGFEGFSYTRSPRVGVMAERSQEIGVTVGSSSGFVLSSPSTTPSHHSPVISILSLGERAEGARGEGESGGLLSKKLETQRVKERLRELDDEREEKERHAARERQKEKEEKKQKKKREQEERMRAEREEDDRQRKAAEERFQLRQQEEQAAVRQTQREEEERKRQSAATAAAAAQPRAVSHLSQQLAAQRLPAPVVSASGVKLAPWARLAAPAAAAALFTPPAAAVPAPSAALTPQIPITVRLFPSLESAASASPSSKTAAAAAQPAIATVAIGKPGGKGKTSWARLF